MPLIKDIKTLKKALGGIQRNMEWDNWSPFVENAEQSYIMPAIGELFYDELTAPLPPDGGDSELRDKLILKLQRASAHYTKASSMFEMSSVVGDAGLMENAPAGTAPMGRWKFIGMLKNSTDNAEKALENALLFLENNKDNEAFVTWREDVAYTLTHESLIASATELTEAFPAARNSRRLFLAFYQYIRNAEIDYIKPLIGESFYKALKTKLLDNEAVWTETEKLVLRYLRLALANYAFCEAIPFLNLTVDFHLESNVYDIYSDALPDANKRTEMKLVCEGNYKDAAVKLRSFLDVHASADVFPEYFNSSLYTIKSKVSPLKRKAIDADKPYILI